MEIAISSIVGFLVLIVAVTLSLVFLLNFNYQPKPISEPRHVVISGGSSGIGLSLARLYVRQGCSHLTLIARNEERLAEAKKLCMIENSSSQVLCISLDLSKSKIDEVKKKLNECSEKHGYPVDVLICCAGQCVPDILYRLSNDEIEQMIDTNVRGTIILVRTVVEMMMGMIRESDLRDRRIAIVSSQAGQVGLYGYSVYSASKFALKGFADALQMELFKHRIFITLCYPPDTDTPGYRTEIERTPKLTRDMADESGLWNTDQVSSELIESIKYGKSACTFGLNGWMLKLLNSGFAVASDPISAIIEAFLYPIVRIIAMFYSIRFYKITYESSEQ